MQTARMELPLLPETVSATEVYVAVLDRQIDETQNFLSLLQALRRAAAGALGKDRDATGGIAKTLQSANRSHYEGDGHQSEGSGE